MSDIYYLKCKKTNKQTKKQFCHENSWSVLFSMVMDMTMGIYLVLAE